MKTTIITFNDDSTDTIVAVITTEDQSRERVLKICENFVSNWMINKPIEFILETYVGTEYDYLLRPVIDGVAITYPFVIFTKESI